MFWLGFLLGGFVGAGAGVFAMCLIRTASDADEQRERALVETCLWVHEFDENGMHVRTTAKISPYGDSGGQE